MPFTDYGGCPDRDEDDNVQLDKTLVSVASQHI